MSVKTIAGLLALPRSDGKELRLTVNEYSAKHGGSPRFISVGLYKDGVDLRSGCTIRKSEISDLIIALERAREVMDTDMAGYTMPSKEFAATLPWGEVPDTVMPIEELQSVIEKARKQYATRDQ